mmetsp:Transcript_499/g.1083  ORF Transcript_499/g.1083 Transcript_499/m.1083 type:complete len:214 (+) Transcript_499:112-753(+)
MGDSEDAANVAEDSVAVLEQAPRTTMRPLCQVSGCENIVLSKNRCFRHGGGKHCEEPNCTKHALGSTKRCSAHGGGRRCDHEGCTKGAQGSTPRCKAHGGGRRCKEEGCLKSAQGPNDLCKAHGGGNNCVEPDCEKSAYGSTGLCRKHGGGPKRPRYQEPPPETTKEAAPTESYEVVLSRLEKLGELHSRGLVPKEYFDKQVSVLNEKLLMLV